MNPSGALIVPSLTPTATPNKTGGTATCPAPTVRTAPFHGSLPPAPFHTPPFHPLTRSIDERKFDVCPVAINRHPSTSVHDHVEHASNSSPPGHSEKHPQHRDGG
jgi:hypothetical protein